MRKKLTTITCSLILATLINTIGLSSTAPITAQILLKESGTKSRLFLPEKKIVFEYLKKDYQKSNINLGRNAKVSIDSIKSNGHWFTASYLIVSRENPNGWAGTVLFKKENGQWTYKAGTQTYQGAMDLLMEAGMSRDEAEFFAEVPDRS